MVWSSLTAVLNHVAKGDKHMIFDMTPQEKKSHELGQVALEATEEGESHLEKHIPSNNVGFLHQGTHWCHDENEVEPHLPDN